MIRNEYIDEIKKYIFSAKIEKVYNADFVLKKDETGDNSFPSFEQILEYTNKAPNLDKFFERIYLTLDQYEKYIKNENIYKNNVELEPLVKRLQLSELTINKILSTLNQTLSFPEIGKYKIKKCISLSFNDSYSDSLNFLYDLLVQLSHKIKDYIIKNSIWSSAYKVEYEEDTKQTRSADPLAVLSMINETVKKILDKKYIPDFLSDGSEDLKEMMSTFWKGLSSLLFYSKPTENVSYLVNNEEVKNIKDYFGNILNEHFKCIDDLLANNSLFDSFSDVQIKEIYEKIIKIKVPKEINPRSESDISNNKCKAEQRLAELIGLDSVKEAIEKIKSYVKATKGEKDINLHMAFYGNPGTGKTEVAKLIGEILYENGVLPKKHYVEATRMDLVGQYIGETAIKTKALIDKAMGGVLFIDEAYSLAVEGDSIDFGNEAVAELIKEMWDNRGKFCVIVAGYKNKLQKMLATNPGFNSRIQFHIDFDNYSRDEIGEIFKLMMDKDGYLATEDAFNKMLDVVDVFRKDPDFANARTASNVLEQCIMCLTIRTGDPNDKTIRVEDVDKYIKDSKISVPTSKNGDNKVLSGEEELNNLIGLENVKTSIKKIRAYAKKNKRTSNLNLHMAFTGNPGTGKSEVANIISRVLFEAGVLSEAKVIIGNRETLVGKYVGETAIKTKEAVQKAMGGVLFIDEAYSLVSGGTNDFGSEAIATLIDEMEKNKGRFCVVVAGYEEPLRAMIASNPGFGSRIQFYIDFPDYSREELKQIALSFLSKESVPYTITNDALEELLNISDFYRYQNDFANARTIRKMLQDVIMNQNLRVEDELDNNEIIIDDVLQYASDNHLIKNTNTQNDEKPLLSKADLENILNSSKNYDSNRISNQYFEQAVVCISGGNSQGTGFLISPDGLCLTCAHCLHGEEGLQQARVILVLADGQKFKNYVNFKILFVDKQNDFAVLKLDNAGMNYKYIPLTLENDSKYESLQEFIMAGYPFGGETYTSISITDGKIASVNDIGNRTVVFADMFGKPGNSGSPVIDKTTKKVIGIYWGGINDPRTGEMINCFTPSTIIFESIKKDI